MNSKLDVAIDIASKKLSQGGIVIYPTETFYGLGALLSHPQAVARLAALKGRVAGKPMPVIAGDEASARSLWLQIPPKAEIFLRRFWPGPLTIILSARPGLPFEIAPKGEVGVRVSSHPVARKLACQAGPLVATSANFSRGNECTLVSQLDIELVRQVEAVIDGGETTGGRPSTVLSFPEGVPTIVREGAIQKALIDACKN
jgi:L-threonylcarbamoyladenylate synthase